MPFGTKAQHNGLTTGVMSLDELGMKHGMSDYYPLFPRGSSSTKSVPLGDSPMDRWHLLAFDESVDLDKLAAVCGCHRKSILIISYIMRF
jgi:hypothetical protein